MFHRTAFESGIWGLLGLFLVCGAAGCGPIEEEEPEDSDTQAPLDCQEGKMSYDEWSARCAGRLLDLECQCLDDNEQYDGIFCNTAAESKDLCDAMWVWDDCDENEWGAKCLEFFPTDKDEFGGYCSAIPYVLGECTNLLYE